MLPPLEKRLNELLVVEGGCLRLLVVGRRGASKDTAGRFLCKDAAEFGSAPKRVGQRGEEGRRGGGARTRDLGGGLGHWEVETKKLSSWGHLRTFILRWVASLAE